MSPRPHFLQPLLKRSRGEVGLFVVGRARPLATSVSAAFDSGTRKRGLLGRDTLPPDEALIIAPCQAVHTFRMRFDIDVIYAARDGRVIKIRQALRPGRISGAWSAFAVVEMAAGAAARTGLESGAKLELRPLHP